MRPLSSKTRAISFEYVDPASIRSNPNNAREHDRKQLAKLTRNIAKHGFLIPVLIDEGGVLLCGHARVAAALTLHLPEIPVVRADNLTEVQKRFVMLADNRLAELSSWNRNALKRELSCFAELDIDFDFEALGYDTSEIDFILGDGDLAEDAPEIAPSREQPAISALGDIWQLGEHRLCCGDALKDSSYRAVLGQDRADMAFTDPPLNFRIDGHAGGLGVTKQREFLMGPGEVTDGQFENFLTLGLRQIKFFAVDGAILFVCMDWHHTLATLHASQGLILKSICVWVKNTASAGSFYRSQHKFVFVFECGAANRINNIELGKHGRSRSTVWEYRGVNGFGRDRDELLKIHPALVADAIKDCSRRGDIILDPFAASGTTLIAAEKTARRAAAIEIDSHCVDAIIRRWQAYSRKSAICVRTGQTFAEREDAKANS